MIVFGKANDRLAVYVPFDVVFRVGFDPWCGYFDMDQMEVSKK